MSNARQQCAKSQQLLTNVKKSNVQIQTLNTITNTCSYMLELKRAIAMKISWINCNYLQMNYN